MGYTYRKFQKPLATMCPRFISIGFMEITSLFVCEYKIVFENRYNLGSINNSDQADIHRDFSKVWNNLRNCLQEMNALVNYLDFKTIFGLIRRNADGLFPIWLWKTISKSILKPLKNIQSWHLEFLGSLDIGTLAFFTSNS